MTVLEKILEKLDAHGFSYTKMEHPPVYTSEEAAKIRDASLSMGAKAIICFADKKPILIVLPGDTKISFPDFKRIFQVKDLRMATADEVRSLTGLEIGSIPPTGSVLGLPSFFDNRFLDKDKIAFNAGSHTVSVMMDSKDLITLENPKFGQFGIDK